MMALFLQMSSAIDEQLTSRCFTCTRWKSVSTGERGYHGNGSSDPITTATAHLLLQHPFLLLNFSQPLEQFPDLVIRKLGGSLRLRAAGAGLDGDMLGSEVTYTYQHSPALHQLLGNTWKKPGSC